MKKYIFIFYLFTLIPVGVSAGEFVSDTWAGISRYIAVHHGTAKSVWDQADRATVTGGKVAMTPIGDGRYQTVLQLSPGSKYNFLFFAQTGSNPPSGLSPNTTYYDCVPTSGNIACGTSPNMVADFGTDRSHAYYAQIHWMDENSNQYYDARRVLEVPSYMNPGTDTLWVYCNFSSKPGSVTNFSAVALDTKTVYLSWGAPGGYWGTGGSVTAADVVAGGMYKLYRNTSGGTEYQSGDLVATLQGDVFNYTDSNLTEGDTYYYVMVAYDAYQGNNGESFAQEVSDTTSQDTAVPLAPVKVRFKVEGFDWDYINKHNRIVYLTPSNCADKLRAQRIKASMARVYLGNVKEKNKLTEKDM